MPGSLCLNTDIAGLMFPSLVEYRIWSHRACKQISSPQPYWNRTCFFYFFKILPGIPPLKIPHFFCQRVSNSSTGFSLGSAGHFSMHIWPRVPAPGRLVHNSPGLQSLSRSLSFFLTSPQLICSQEPKKWRLCFFSSKLPLIYLLMIRLVKFLNEATCSLLQSDRSSGTGLFFAWRLYCLFITAVPFGRLVQIYGASRTEVSGTSERLSTPNRLNGC